MIRWNNRDRRLLGLLASLFLLVMKQPARAWDETGHMLVTELALPLLPQDMPEFLRAPETIRHLVYLSVEPDRWRNLDDLPMGQHTEPDHYFDIDLLPLYDLTPSTLPPLRYDYLTAIMVYKSRNPDKDYGYDRAKDPEHAHEWPGFAPYRVSELYVLLRSSWRTYNTYSRFPQVVDDRTLASCRANIIHHMGLLSHYVADLAQPLHTTKHHHGWVGDNPEGYSTEHGLHQQIDGGVIAQTGISLASCSARGPQIAGAFRGDAVFQSVVEYAQRSHGQVERLYQLEREGAFRPGSERLAEGTAFIESRLVDAGGFLAALWASAYRDAGIDPFRETRLKARMNSGSNRSE